MIVQHTPNILVRNTKISDVTGAPRSLAALADEGLHNTKHRTHILAVMNAFAKTRPQGIYIEPNMAEFFQAASPYMVFASRHMLDNILQNVETYRKEEGQLSLTREGNPEFRQIIPYNVLARIGSEGQNLEVLLYQRGSWVPEHDESGATVGEKRLAGQWSVGWGGHVDLDETVAGFTQEGGNLCFGSIVEEAAIREFREELKYISEDGKTESECHADMFRTVAASFMINLNEVPVDQLHLGVANVYMLRPEHQILEAGESGLRLTGWTPVGQLHEYACESWTKELIPHLVELQNHLLANRK